MPPQTSVPDLTAILADPDVHSPSLLMSISHILSSSDVLDPALQPTVESLDVNGDLNPTQMDEIRRLALDALTSHLAAGSPPIESPNTERAEQMLRFLLGDETSNLLPMLYDEVSIVTEAEASPAARIRKLPEERRENFNVAIIGAGMSGILSAIRMKEAGIPFVVLEKNPDVGGTWYENTYPGCRCDVPNTFYSYSFRPHVWSYHYSPQSEILDYLSGTADEYGIREHIKFNTDVLSATHIDGRWTVTVRDENGVESAFVVNAVISAVGQLNRPMIPDIAGAADFNGPAFHSASWRHDVDITGKRVAVIGTGASAMQFVPEVALQATKTLVFQRNAPWILPNPRYRQPVGQGHRWLLENAPGYRDWYRLWLLGQADAKLAGMTVDPTWGARDRSASAPGDEIRKVIEASLVVGTRSNPELLDDVLPKYPYGANRRLIDDGTWLATLQKPNVDLISDHIESITPTGIRTVDGREHEVDVILYGTGFAAEKFLWPMDIRGQGGMTLAEEWGSAGPRAYLGATLPGFPNLFILYGPNTNLSHGGSMIFMVESQMRYILGCIELVLGGDHAGIAPTRAAFEEFNDMIDEENSNRVWGDPEFAVGWYKKGKGRVFATWPLMLREFWSRTRHARAEDHQLLAADGTEHQ